MKNNIALKLFTIYAALLLFAVVFAQDTEKQTFPAILDDASQVYDGDTIKTVYIDIADLKSEYPAATLWPGVFIKGDDLYAVTDIRIAGIDTPEKRPAKAGRTEESRQREKDAAEVAKKELLMLIETNNMEFVVANPQLGKYAGRIVAEVYIGDVDVADYMIEKGLAYPYDGSTKQAFDSWYQGD